MSNEFDRVIDDSCTEQERAQLDVALMLADSTCRWQQEMIFELLGGGLPRIMMPRRRPNG